MSRLDWYIRYDNSARSYIGVINEDDVVNTPIDHSIDYNLLGKIYGGSALEKFKNLSSKALNAAKTHQIASRGLHKLGDYTEKKGWGKKRGGVLIEPTYGGAKASKRSLASRLNKY